MGRAFWRFKIPLHRQLDSIFKDFLMQTIQDIARQCITEDLQPEDILALKNMNEDDLPVLHHTYGRTLRNKYDLWHSHPLTQNWRNNPESRFLIQGIDHSDDHPDAISSKIILSIWKEVNAV